MQLGHHAQEPQRRFDLVVVGVALDDAVEEDLVHPVRLARVADGGPQGGDGGEVGDGPAGEVVGDEDGVDVRGRVDVAGGHVGEDGAGGGDVGGVVAGELLAARGEEAVEDGAVGEEVRLDALPLHVREDGHDGALLRLGREGVEGRRRVRHEAVDDDAEGDDVGRAVRVGHLLEVGLDGGLRAAPDDGPEEDVEGEG